MSDTPISSLPGLGPAFEASCLRAGIVSAEALRDLGTDAAYAKLMASGTRPHFIGFYVIEMALQGRPWNDCQGDEKAALRRRFDALKAARATQRDDPAAPPGTEDAAFEAMMNAIGVIDPEQT